MAPRLLTAILALALVGDGEVETDPFFAALAGKSGPEAVAAPSFDPDLEAVSWSLRPRREIVDALAARLLRGEAGAWYEPAKDVPPLAVPPSRIPEDFEPGKFEVVDRLASRVPADAAVVFFGSLKEAEEAVDGLTKFLPEALPGLCGDPPGGRRDALRRAVDMLLLPTIWRSNPEVRTGTRQVALVVSDPDLRWAPDIALVCEVDDASLVRAHRQATFSWEDRGNRRIRVDGLDAVADDGSIRSFFALEGGFALWSTTRALRERILAAGSGKAPSLLAPPARDYAFARKTFPRAEGGALLVVPEAFLARLNAAEFRASRAAALRCEAVRLLFDARLLAGQTTPGTATPAPGCPSRGVLQAGAGRAGAACSVHGTASCPTPAGDRAGNEVMTSDAARIPTFCDPWEGDVVSLSVMPISARWRARPMELNALRPYGFGLPMRSIPPAWRQEHISIKYGGNPGPPAYLAARARRFAGQDAILETLTGLALSDPKVQLRGEIPLVEEILRFVEPR